MKKKSGINEFANEEGQKNKKKKKEQASTEC